MPLWGSNAISTKDVKASLNLVISASIAPKRFARLARLQHTVRAMVLVPERPLLEIGLDSGFCDQPHLIHEFQELTGLTPLQLRQSLLQGVHYYHAPLRQR